MPDVLERCRKLPGSQWKGKYMSGILSQGKVQDQVLDIPGSLEEGGQMPDGLDKLLNWPFFVNMSEGGERSGEVMPGDVMPSVLVPGDLMPGDVMPGSLVPGGGPGVSWCPAYWLLRREEGGQRTEDREGSGQIVPDQDVTGCLER